jgi:hypothetical protein
LQKNFTFTSEMIVALIAFLTSVYLSVYMGWAVHAIRLVPRFTNSLLACCGRKCVLVFEFGWGRGAGGTADLV